MAVRSLAEGKWPERVGLLAIEIYFPSLCVRQTDLEAHDGVPGKYTVGLGQQTMGFCGDNEDVNSLSLTVLRALMEKNSVSYSDIGRLEVGTETVIDKSKSVKTVLMQLFTEHGNTDIDGVETRNACYGGTQAFFNSVAWVESSAWDGRFAVVIAADIATYASGNARPTGGAGAVAMLIGPNAPLYVERGLRSIHMEHAYDFYKPNLSSEYPLVDGKLSLQCYLRALDTCYERFKAKYDRVVPTSSHPFSVEVADWFAFHSPFSKLVQKGYARMMLHDLLSGNASSSPNPSLWDGVDSFRSKKLEETYFDKDTEKAFMKASSELFERKVVPSLLLSREIGNMYTSSVYGGIVSLLAQKTVEELSGTRLVMFSYGSGLASAMYSLCFTTDHSDSSHLRTLVASCADLQTRLKSRRRATPAEFEATLKLREDTHLKAPYTPQSNSDELFPGTYYLTNVDDKYRRQYKQVALVKALQAREPMVAPLHLGKSITNGISNGVPVHGIINGHK